MTPERWAKHLAKMKEWRSSESGSTYLRGWREQNVGWPFQEHYARKLEEQQGLCAICGNPPKDSRRLSMDHDHRCCQDHVIKSCGRCLRGLLCDRCNRAIAHLGEDNIIKAARYLDLLEKTDGSS